MLSQQRRVGHCSEFNPMSTFLELVIMPRYFFQSYAQVGDDLQRFLSLLPAIAILVTPTIKYTCLLKVHPRRDTTVFSVAKVGHCSESRTLSTVSALVITHYPFRL